MIKIVYVAMEVINPDYQVPIAVYETKEEALENAGEDDVYEVMFYTS